MAEYVRVAVNVPNIADGFDYLVPSEWEGGLCEGQLVVVPFGRQITQGVVLYTIGQPSVAEPRPIMDLVDSEPVLTPQQIKLGQVLAQQSFTSLGVCLALMVPLGLRQRAVQRYVLKPLSGASSLSTLVLSDTQEKIISLLKQHGEMSSTQLERALSRRQWQTAIQKLIKVGIISTTAALTHKTIHPKTMRSARLACTPQEVKAKLETIARANTPALIRRQIILSVLMEEGEAVEVSWLYAACAVQMGSNKIDKGKWLQDLYALQKQELILLEEDTVWRDPLNTIHTQTESFLSLTPAQSQVWERLQETPGDKPFLLFGVTGSGKTEIYLHAVAETLRQGKQAIVLVPEISLTPQTIRRFMARFPQQVGLVHSKLSEGERYDTWQRARAGELPVMVGARSALFAPLQRLGLIIADECHDSSYFQADKPPTFHTIDLAEAYARLSGAVCLFGSATPDVIHYHHAKNGTWQLLELPERIVGHEPDVRALLSCEVTTPITAAIIKGAGVGSLPTVHLIDMRQELKEGNRSIFSRSLQHAFKETLSKHQQAIFFINRRGAASYVFCRDCGFVVKCSRCDTPLTYHDVAAEPMLRCHFCAYQRKMPKKCPQCASERIRQYGTGTQTVENELKALFPQVRILRWDSDSTRRKGAHDDIMQQFILHKADVLVGTQMLAKGLDLPLVTLVGIVLADVGLNFPDYRAGERTFQTLMQVAGRAGRSALGGKVILQTFQPEHDVIQAVANQSYPAFYNQEINFRHKIGYPPFSQMLRLEFRSLSPTQVEEATLRVAEQIQTWIDEEERRETEIIGPVPCFFTRMNGYYRWHVIVRTPQAAALLNGRVPKDCLITIDPPSLL